MSMNPSNVWVNVNKNHKKLWEICLWRKIVRRANRRKATIIGWFEQNCLFEFKSSRLWFMWSYSIKYPWLPRYRNRFVIMIDWESLIFIPKLYIILFITISDWLSSKYFIRIIFMSFHMPYHGSSYWDGDNGRLPANADQSARAGH